MKLNVIPLDEEDHFLIYRPLLGLAFIGNSDMVDFCSTVEPKSMDVGQNGGNVTYQFLRDIGYFSPEILPYNPDRILTTAVLLLTNQCQLRCTYCYAAAGDMEPQHLSVESGKRVVDYVCEQAISHEKDSIRVDFHGGGEPSMEWETLKELTDYVRRKNLSANISLTSNGIWSKSQCEWIVVNIDRLTISMDGSPDTQNRQRPFRNNHPSSEYVLGNIAKLDESGKQYGIRMTVCHPWDQLFSDVAFILEHTACRSIQIEPAFNPQRGTHFLPFEEQYQDFAKAFLKAYDQALEYGVRLIYSGARPGTVTRAFCSAPYNAVILNPEDDIVACYEVVNRNHPLSVISNFGSVVDGKVVINEGKRQKFYYMLDKRFEATCSDCFCQWTCAGDCYTRVINHSDDWMIKSPRCSMNQAITRDLLLNYIHEQNGICRLLNIKNESE